MGNQFADETDRAAFIADQSNADALARHHRVKERVPSDFDGVTCYDCGVELQDYRLKIQAFRCVDCQSIHELRLSTNRKFFRGE